ncbi:DNA-binding LacI/PurR family transcriptional regulator [Streptomyces sp. SAI-041]|nr:DNA-binding LacI/PurR family transcriptional regulator [Streptomyces sp. SAI-041]
MESVLAQGVDGIVVSEPLDEGSVSLSVDVPVLVLGAPAAFGGPRTVAAGVGAESPARVATEHLLDLGRTRSITWRIRSGDSPPGTVSRAGTRRSASTTFPSPPTSPPLTTVRQPFDAVAREGLRLLV